MVTKRLNQNDKQNLQPNNFAMISGACTCMYSITPNFPNSNKTNAAIRALITIISIIARFVFNGCVESNTEIRVHLVLVINFPE